MTSEVPSVALPPFGVLVQESRHGDDFSMPAHRHDCLSLLVAVDGSGICRVGDMTLPLAVNDVLLLPEALEHQVVDEPRQPLTLFVVYLGLAWTRRCESLLQWRAQEGVRRLRLVQQGATEIRRLLRRVLHEQSHQLPGREELIPAALVEMLVAIRRTSEPASGPPPHPRGQDRVRQVAQYVREHYYEQWSLPEAARLASMSVRTFSEAFKGALGSSFIQFLNRIRVEEARRLLQQGHVKVSTVCFEAGFEDLSHFYRVFRQVTGYPPGEERKRHHRPKAPGAKGTRKDRP